jgi:prepilin-type N-terminal cleavage/methylation domain-containing protein
MSIKRASTTVLAQTRIAGTRPPRAFTLVELLVVIALVGLLVSILLPSLGRARMVARQTREMAAARTLMLAFTMYADASKGVVLPGYPTGNMVDGPIQVLDDGGQRVLDERAQRYPWRLAPFLNYEFRGGLYENDRLLADIRAGSPEYAQYGVDFQYIVSLYPSLGMNIAFVGGSDRHGEFDPAFRRLFGRVYIERMDQANRPGGVIAFVSARGDPQPAIPFLSDPQGFYRVEPPCFAASQPRSWADGYDARTTQPGPNSGFVSLRYAGKAVGAHLDGHAELLDWAALNDMRRWADQAPSADWAITPR